MMVYCTIHKIQKKRDMKNCVTTFIYNKNNILPGANSFFHCVLPLGILLGDELLCTLLNNSDQKYCASFLHQMFVQTCGEYS